MQSANTLQAEQSLNDEILQRNLLRFIKGYVGEFVTYAQIAKQLNKPERTIRLAVRDLRRRGEPICSESGKGIGWPADRSQVDITAAELRSRAKDLFETANALEQGADRYFGKQAGLL